MEPYLSSCTNFLKTWLMVWSVNAYPKTIYLILVLIAGTYMYRTICSKPGPHTTTQTELQLNHGSDIVNKSTNDEYFAMELAKMLAISVHSSVVWLSGTLAGKNI